MPSNLALEVVEKLKQMKLTISSAESLTGGLVGVSLSSISGASEVFKGSVVAYTDEIKINVLNVDSQVINQFTSISEQVALLMAQNVRKLMNSDIGIATTGVAGPNPSAGFEPGIVFVAFSSDDHNMCQKLELTGSRADICGQSVEKILQLTLSRLV